MADKTTESGNVAETKPPPGTIIDKGKPSARKVPWTYKDMKQFPEVTFTPEETIKIIYNGLLYQLVADRETIVPSVIKGLYDDHRKAMRKQSDTIMTNFGVVKVSAGAGALEPEAFIEMK